MSSFRASLIAAANAAENWDIEYLVNALVISPSQHGGWLVDSSNLGVHEAETLYKFLRSLKSSAFEEEHWDIICEIADELVRFQGYPFCDPNNREDSPFVLSPIYLAWFVPETAERSDRTALRAHRRMFPPATA